MKRSLIYLFIICTACMSLNCKKTPDDQPGKPHPEEPLPCDTCLPPITTTGKNTFGCRVNGKVWLPKNTWFTPATYLELYSPDYENVVGIIARNYSDVNNQQGISLFLASITDTSTIYFPNSILNYSRGFYSTTTNFEAKPIKNGYVQFLRVDRINGVVSGTFEFDVYDKYNLSDLDTIHITDGRFDISK